MNIKISTKDYRFTGSKSFSIEHVPNQIEPFYENKKDYRNLLDDYRDEIDELQNMMYAHNRYSLLLIFQAMDAAGKDGTIRRVMSGINPHGVVVHSFKKPSTEELEHDYLWRTTRKLPQRGKIGIFNRSYYEEVLVVKVHPGILTGSQMLPEELVADKEKVFQERYQDIRQFETYLHRNGTRVIKFFLHLSRDEQRDRFLDRLNTPSKNWKFSESDVKERQYWDDSQKAYEECINATSTPEAPWYVIPADDKKNMRLMVCDVILQHMRELNMHYPKVSPEREADFETYRKMLADD